MPYIPSPNLLFIQKNKFLMIGYYIKQKSHVLFYDKFFPDLDREDFYKC